MQKDYRKERQTSNLALLSARELQRKRSISPLFQEPLSDMEEEIIRGLREHREKAEFWKKKRRFPNFQGSTHKIFIHDYCRNHRSGE